MRPEVFAKLEELAQQKKILGYRDGWVYGMLKREFELTSDELSSLVKVLGFKLGWNPTVEKILEEQWQLEADYEKEVAQVKSNIKLELEQIKVSQQRERDLQERRRESNRIQDEAKYLSDVHKIETEAKVRGLLLEYQQNQVASRQFTEMEKGIIILMLRMNLNDQRWLLEMMYDRFSKLS
jgi:hypothetical protein